MKLFLFYIKSFIQNENILKISSDDCCIMYQYPGSIWGDIESISTENPKPICRKPGLDIIPYVFIGI